MDLTVIKNFRKVKGYKQSELAAKVGVTQSYISMLEKGLRTDPPITVVEKILEELDFKLTIQIL